MEGHAEREEGEKVPCRGICREKQDFLCDDSNFLCPRRVWLRPPNSFSEMSEPIRRAIYAKIVAYFLRKGHLEISRHTAVRQTHHTSILVSYRPYNRKRLYACRRGVEGSHIVILSIKNAYNDLTRERKS